MPVDTRLCAARTYDEGGGADSTGDVDDEANVQALRYVFVIRSINAAAAAPAAVVLFGGDGCCG